MTRTCSCLAKNVSRVLIIFAGIAWGLIIWDIDLTPLFASAGIAGIAIALAAKDTMANFIGGISLFADRAYKVGDYIILDSGERGEVVDMGIRSTRIKTRDDVMISIPNSILANIMIINESAPEPRFRIRIDVGVAYGSDLRKVEKTLLGVAEENETLVRKPGTQGQDQGLCRLIGQLSAPGLGARPRAKRACRPTTCSRPSTRPLTGKASPSPSRSGMCIWLPRNRNRPDQRVRIISIPAPNKPHELRLISLPRLPKDHRSSTRRQIRIAAGDTRQPRPDNGPEKFSRSAP